MIPLDRVVAGRPTATQMGHSAEVLSHLTAPRHRARFWVAMWTAAVVVQLVALRPVLLPEGEPLPAFLVMYHVVGFAFTSCGLAAWRRRPDSSVGRLMTTAGFLLYAWPVIGQISSPGARIAASILEDLWAIPMVALLLTHHSAGRLTSRVDRVLVAPFVIAVPLELSALLFIDQEGNPLLLASNSTAAVVILTVSRVLSVVACLAVAAVIAARWRVASRPQRRAMLPSVAGIISLLLFAALNTMADPPPALLWAAITSLMVVPAAFLTVLLRSRLARAGLAQLIRDLDRKRGPELQAALGRALGDPGLVIAYPTPGGSGAYLDSLGAPISLPTADTGSAMAPIEHHGRLVAVLVYDASLDDDPDLVEAVRAAATIALENVRMQQETQARLAELRDSRSRIVAAGDAERRRIERNLHDGAQQRLATLALQLASIQSRIREDPGSAELMVSTAADELTRSLQELRELARGIHPSVLEHGLRPGLESLANRSAVPTSIVMETDDPLPSQVAFAAYFVTSEALANVAKHARATSVTVRVTTTSESLILQITDDGIGGASEEGGSGLRGLVDRVEALEGHLDVQSDAGLGTTLTAVLPLAFSADQPGQPRQSPMTNS